MTTIKTINQNLSKLIAELGYSSAGYYLDAEASRRMGVAVPGHYSKYDAAEALFQGAHVRVDLGYKRGNRVAETCVRVHLDDATDDLAVSLPEPLGVS